MRCLLAAAGLGVRQHRRVLVHGRGAEHDEAGEERAAATCALVRAKDGEGTASRSACRGRHPTGDQIIEATVILMGFSKVLAGF